MPFWLFSKTARWGQGVGPFLISALRHYVEDVRNGAFAFEGGVTETVEAHNPALTATGLAIWGWLVRIVVTGCFLCLPLVVKSVTPLIEAPLVIATYKQMAAAKQPISPEIMHELGAIKAAAAAAPEGASSFTAIS